jgi:hypothetical protein
VRRVLSAFVVGLLAVAAARADIPIPPPPGKKFVKVEVILTTDKAHPDYEFYATTPFAVQKVEFGPDSPAKFAPVRYRPGGAAPPAPFWAVPKGAGAGYPNTRALFNALSEGKVTGQAALMRSFPHQATIDATDKRTVVAETYAVEKIDAKAGIVVKATKAPAGPPPGASNKNAPGDEIELSDDTGTAYAPRGGTAVAGLAAALALAFAGVWLTRRSRT